MKLRLRIVSNISHSQGANYALVWNPPDLTQDLQRPNLSAKTEAKTPSARIVQERWRPDQTGPLTVTVQD